MKFQHHIQKGEFITLIKISMMYTKTKEEKNGNYPSGTQPTKRDVCSICGTDIVNDDKNCPICFDEQFNKLKNAYSKNINSLTALYKDLFKFCLDLSDEYAKSMHGAINGFLELQRKVEPLNPSWHYVSMSYQALWNGFFAETIQNTDVTCANLAQIYKTTLSITSNFGDATANNAGMLWDLYQSIFQIRQKHGLSEEDMNLVQTISNVNKLYESYDRDRQKGVNRK